MRIIKTTKKHAMSRVYHRYCAEHKTTKLILMVLTRLLSEGGRREYPPPHHQGRLSPQMVMGVRHHLLGMAAAPLPPRPAEATSPVTASPWS